MANQYSNQLSSPNIISISQVCNIIFEHTGLTEHSAPNNNMFETLFNLANNAICNHEFPCYRPLVKMLAAILSTFSDSEIETYKNSWN